MNTKILKMAFAGLVLGVSGLANAGLIGSTVTVTNTYESSIFDGPTDVLVQSGIVSELTEFGDLWDINIDDDSIDMVCNYSQCNDLIGFDEYLFEGLTWGGANFFTGFSMTTNTTGLIVNALMPTSTSLYLSMELTAMPIGSVIHIDFQESVSVPEPSILAIFALGIMGLASSRFKK
ncbi:PEP-CTERM sorting domain-containing protein [uncultured Paraglaciecola sp.]|uniref:PEP-CTERM sorting domain-containing protein n=1 Tax=uncultured Paraglaciecola sp. TaxID=1765024 RepID=UPI0030DD1BD7|tara:strand:+ start:100481 stop:101011 length:531 start_codon:yes stop_codon:yes gene_type:complete